MMYVIFQLRVAENTGNISCFPRRLQRNTFRLPGRLQDVFAIRFPKTSSRRVCKTSCSYVCKTSSRRLGRQKNITLKTSSRRLQYVFTKTNVCWEVAQSSYDVCHVSAQNSWEVVQSSYDLYPVSDQSSWKVAQSSYDVCLVSAQSSWEVVQSNCDVCFCFSSE